MKANAFWDKYTQHYSQRGIKRSNITYDGKIRPESYNANKGILFILKESNDFRNGDLSDLLKDGPRYQMWHNVARWSAGILHDFPDFRKINYREVLTEALHQVAVINLKKETGRGTADMSVINYYTFMDKALLLEQIREISPKIIIACGTIDPLVWLLEIVEEGHPYPIDRPVFAEKFGAMVFPWRHPARLAKVSENYSALRKCFRDQGILRSDLIV